MTTMPSILTTAAPPPARPGRLRLLAGGVLFALLAAGGLAGGTIPRLKQDRAVRHQAATNSAQTARVAVATATRVAPDAERVLPGNWLPLTEIAIYPRTTGYLKRWTVDIGERVGRAATRRDRYRDRRPVEQTSRHHPGRERGPRSAQRHAKLRRSERRWPMTPRSVQEHVDSVEQSGEFRPVMTEATPGGDEANILRSKLPVVPEDHAVRRSHHRPNINAFVQADAPRPHANSST